MEAGSFGAAAGNVAIADFASCGVQAENTGIRRRVGVMHELEGADATAGLRLRDAE